MAIAKKTAITIARFCAFWILAALMFIGISLVMVPWSMDSQSARGIYAEEKDSLDMLYIGGSVCLMSWQPYEAWDESGIASYSYGWSSLTSYNVVPLVQEAMERQSPKLLVVDLRVFQLTEDEGKPSDIALERNMLGTSPHRMAVIDNIFEYHTDLEPADTRTSFVFDIIRSHGTWRSISENSFKYALTGIVASETKGYRPTSDLGDKHAVVHLNDNSEVTGSSPVSYRAEEDLRYFIDFAKQEGFDVLFVAAPYSESATEREQYNYLARIIQENGYEYLNSNDMIDEIGIDNTNDFYDARHLNIFGAEKYTRWLANYLQSRYEVPDRRGGSLNSTWSEGYRKWREYSDANKLAMQKIIDGEAARNAG